MKRALAIALLVLAACDQEDDDAITESAVCGSEEIRGMVLDPIKGKGICGIEEPVRVSVVSGVRLMPPATLNCKAAQALNTYVSTKAIPDIGDLGGGLDHLEVAASYACRTRNNQGGKMSEHAVGNAIDISAFVLDDGQALVVDHDWDKAVMKELHHDGCGIFGTVLGPNSDRHHHNHFHFDVASYRTGPWCR
jgi:hypothetical protein